MFMVTSRRHCDVRIIEKVDTCRVPVNCQQLCKHMFISEVRKCNN
jgi:hypothetical protein